MMHENPTVSFWTITYPIWRAFISLSTSFFLLCPGNVTSFAQEFPVLVQVTLPGPHSIYISDYAAPESNLQLIVRLRDLDRSEYRMKFRITIEGMGITLRTKSTYTPFPSVLQGGVTEIFTGYDLRNYFHPDNLDFFGITKSQFAKTRTLPEGLYTFYFEVLDFQRGVPVSNRAMTAAWLIQNDPPLLNVPFNNEKIVAHDPQNIMFSWTPRHLASPNSAFNTEYEFSLIELYPANRNPNDLFRSVRPIFQTTTTQTSLLYGMTETLLIPGRKYAYRVRAYDIGKRDVFRNSGYSEVFTFQYGDACLLPSNVRAQSLDETRLKIEWIPQSFHTGFEVRWKEEGARDWAEQRVSTDYIIIPGLKPSTSYVYQVTSYCGTLTGSTTDNNSVRTRDKKEEAFVCGSNIPPVIGGTSPLQNELKVDDVIYTADFEISITSLIKNMDGSYQGSGFAFLPWLNLASVQVKFRKIFVNDQYRIYAGNVTTVYTKGSKFAAKLDLNTKDPTTENSVLASDQNTGGEVIIFEGVINSIIANSQTGILSITDNEGKVTNQSWPTASNGERKQVRVVDENGDTWVVEKDGSVSKGAEASVPAAVASADEVNFEVVFDASKQVYGLDQPSDNTFGTEYETETIQGEQRKISWKSVEVKKQDYLTASVAGRDKFPPSIGFKSSNQPTASEAGEKESEREVLVLGGEAGSQEALTAYALVKTQDSTQNKELVMGRVNVISYQQVRRSVYLVPVNGASIPDATIVSEQLNKIYSQAVASWDVHIMASYGVDTDIVSLINDDESGLVSNYTEPMQRVIRMYRFDNNLDPQGLYLFFIRGTRSNRAGFMPLMRGFGFIFPDKAGGGNEHVVRSIAHELGHGAFGLRHPFDEFGLSQGATENIMDYGNGTALKKYQWDRIHDPELMISWLQDDDEGAASWVLVDRKHTSLFNHIYDRHKLGTTYYYDKAMAASTEEIPLEYDEASPDADWINDWKIRTLRLDSVFADELNGIVTTRKGEKIPEIALRQKNIYLGNYAHHGKIYPVAVYSNGSATIMKNAFTKVEVTELSELEEPANRKHLYVEETYTKYFIIAFYEEGRTDPSIMMQIEKFTFDNSLEKWLKYLRILIDNKNSHEKNEEVFLSEVIYVSQFDESIFGQCVGCWSTKCCRRATEYMMGNTNIANCADSVIATTAPYMPTVGSIVTGFFIDNSSQYSKSAYNNATLQINKTKGIEAANYMIEQIKVGNPVLIGVHYTNGGTPPNNLNRATRHFMVVVGWSRVDNSISFRFYDPGRSLTRQTEAISAKNLLLYNPENGEIKGNYNNELYTLTEIVKTH